MRRVSFDWKVAARKAQHELSYVNNLVGMAMKIGLATLIKLKRKCESVKMKHETM